MKKQNKNNRNMKKIRKIKKNQNNKTLDGQMLKKINKKSTKIKD